MSDALRKQGSALENQFFSEVDAKLLAQIRQRMSELPKREALAIVANIKDPQVLDALLALDIDATTFAAMTFVPVSAVAWADGSLDDKERTAILQAAEQHGIKAGNPGYTLLAGWLAQAPPQVVVSAWYSYISALKQETDPAWFKSLRSQILGLAEKVAEASGGILGLGTKVSPAERTKLAELTKAFEV